MIKVKIYSVSLEEKVVNEAKKIMKPHGSKLSPMINEFLIKFNEEHEKELKELNNKNKKGE